MLNRSSVLLYSFHIRSLSRHFRYARASYVGLSRLPTGKTKLVHTSVASKNQETTEQYHFKISPIYYSSAFR
ncbi:hypothetical protein TNCT_219661 [Trichonephila clavata]|uniref:Uncharacterized protein n=1 Tax=Trichonephila clavata TaxID=2740835 RepID=A0A8X6IN50_TRICU|nr:hypothetical protein TNCT_219661 [Trichonephila clavata]